MDLLDERFAFQFYVMGTLGVKMGIEAKVAVGIGSTKLGSIGVSAEFGPYIKLWGYFIYEYSKLRPANTDTWIYDERKMGALYLEFGLYLEVGFEAQVLGGLLSYNPTLYDKEFPLLTVGNRKNYYSFGYELEEDEVVIIDDEDKNSNNGITMLLPENYRMMNYLDLVEGNIEKEVGDFSRFIVTLSNRNFQLHTETGIITVNVPEGVQYMECDLTLTWKMGKLEFVSKDITITIPLVWSNLSTEELNQKYTVTVKAGNAQDGYTTVWSTRVKKNAFFNLPTEDEILDLIGFDNYNYGSENLKYENVIGYGDQNITDLTVYTDTTYYFDVIPREYTLTVKGVQDINGNIKDMQFKARYGESFDLSALLASGSKNASTGTFTTYLKTEATLNGSKIIGTGPNAREINQNIAKPIDNVFASQILSGVVYTAVYTDNSVNVTFKFTGKHIDIADKTVTIEKGTMPPDIFSEELAELGIIIKSITPALSKIVSDTTFTINCELSVAPSFWITFHTNGGSTIAAREIQEGSILIKPADPQKTGYSFDGWYTDEALTKPFDFSNAFMPGKNFDLYAKWVAETKTITFDSNEGQLPSGAPGSKTVTYGEQYGTLPTPVRTGYKFLGWFTSRTGGTKINETDTVEIVNNIVVYAHWQEKSTINPSIIRYTSGQSKVYNRNNQPFVFTVDGLPVSSFEVYYKRQGLDSSYSTEAINAGTYDIKLVRQEDENYKYFETLLIGVYTIQKAESRILTAPTAAQVVYGNIVPNRMRYDVDYIGDGVLEFAASDSESYIITNPLSIGFRPKQPSTGWYRSGVVYNIYDNGTIGSTRVFLWVRHAESENYKASEPVASEDYYNITRPKSLLHYQFSDDGPLFTYKLVIKTSNIDNAGTNSKISVKVGDGLYQHLDSAGKDDFEKGNTDTFVLDIIPEHVYSTCLGSIPITLKYEKGGTAAGWHCEWVRLDIYSRMVPDVIGNTYYVNHWFGAEDYNKNLIEETYNLTGYERVISVPDDYFNEYGSTSVSSYSYDFKFSFFPFVYDTSRDKALGGLHYYVYDKINAPEIDVSFENPKYNRFITREFDSFSVKNKELYQAMMADKVRELKLTYSVAFKPVNGKRSVTEATSVLRTKTLTFTCSDVPYNSLSSNTTYQLSQSAKSLFNLYRGQLANVNMEVSAGTNGTFDVSYGINDNAGIWGTKFAVNYDKTKVELQGYTLGNVFSENEVTAPERIDNGRYVFLATRSDFTDTTAVGKIVTLRFKVKDGERLTDYPVSLDTSSIQSINAESGIISLSLDSSTAKISVSGKTRDILKQDTAAIDVQTGTSDVKSVSVKKDDGSFIDITDSYQNGYIINENGVYTFKLETTSGETATTSIIYSKIDTVKPVVAVNANGYSSGTWTKDQVTLTVSNEAQNLGTTIFMYKTGDGEWNTYTEPVVVFDESGETIYSFKAISEAGIESDISTVIVRIDKTTPKGDIKIGSNSIKKVLNAITFGLFFKDTQEVTITSSDDHSGIKSIQYYLSTEILDESEVLNISSWTDYTGPISMIPDNKYIVYAKITDNLDNSIYIGSDGITIDSILPEVNGIEDGNEYCISAQFTVSDDNLDSVTANGDIINPINGMYILTAPGEYNVAVTDKSGNTVSFTITVNPSHTYDYDCDTICNICGSERPVIHSWQTEWSFDDEKHWIECSVCHIRKDESAHISEEDDNDCTTAALCTVCGATAIPVQSHDFSGALLHDENGHWHKCIHNGCTVTDARQNHVWTEGAHNPPSYLEDGQRIDTCICGETKIIVLPKLTDIIAPTGTVTINKNSWNSFLNGITFGLFFKETQTVTATAEDAESGIDKTYYYLSDKELSESDAKNITSWTEFNGSFSINPNNRFVVYVKIIDKAGNSSIINTNGLVLDNILPDVYGLEEGKIYCTSVEFTVSDDNLDVVTSNGVVLIPKGGKYTLTAAGNNNVVVTDKSGNTVIINVTVNADHTYDNDCDRDCNVCGDERTITHSWQSEWSFDDEKHWIECSICHIIKDESEHTPEEDDNDCSTAVHCSVCDAITTPAQSHDFSGALLHDENGHWHECINIGCSVTDNKQNHVWTEGTPNPPPTYFEDGQRIDICICGATKTIVLPKLTDITAPAGTIKIDKNSWNSFLNGITFGLFFKETQKVVVTAEDAESGIDKTYYYLSDKELSESDVKNISSWTEFNGSFSINPNNKYVVYVKITDKVGNSSIINTDGVVLDNILPVISGATDGKTYCSEVTISVSDDNLDTVKLDGRNIALVDGKFTVSPANHAQTITVTDKSGNEKSISITVNSSHTWDAGVVTLEPTASSKGIRTYTCIHCGETMTEEIDMLTPSVTEGQNSTWKPEEGGSLTFRSDASFSDFIGVLVDGDLIDPMHYDVEEGSIIVTLKADYLATLPAGKHQVGIKSVTGIATAEFTIEEKPSKPDDKDPPKTADSNLNLWIALLYVSGGALSVIGLKVIKKKEE